MKDGTMGRMMKAATLLGIATATLALGGCKKEPTGQVVATVDGQEITQRDLMAEFQASGGRTKEDFQTVQPQLIDAVVTRKIVVEEAKRQNLDKNPQYLSLLNRTQETLLAQSLAQTWNNRNKPADAGAARAFIAQNPTMFGGRKVMLVNEIRVEGKAVSDAQLTPLHSNDQVAAFLDGRKVKYERGMRTVDSISLPPELANKLVSAAGGEPVGIRSGAVMAVTQVMQVRDAPVPADRQLQLAQQAMQQRAAMQTVSSEVKRLRDAADIKYAEGFAPKKAPGEK